MLLNTQDEKNGCKLLFTLAVEGMQYELGHTPGMEQPYITWAVSAKAPTQHYMRLYFYTLDAALADLQQRIGEALHEKMTAFANQHG